MAEVIEAYLDDQPCTPENIREFGIDIQFDKNRGENRSVINTNSWTFVREDNDFLLGHIAKGLKDGVGITEGPKLDLYERVGNGALQQVYKGCLDMTKQHSISKFRSTFESIELGQEDWLNQKLESTYFSDLADLGVILPSDYKLMPYCINSVPDYEQAAILLAALYGIEAQLLSIVNRLIAYGVEVSNPFEATAIVRTALFIVEIGFITIAMVKTIKNLVDVIIQPVKYHTCMNAYTSMQKALGHFGMTFRSPILESDPFNKMVVMPEKYQVPKDKNRFGLLGFTDPDNIESTGYYKGTVAQLALELATMFSGKYMIIGSEVWLVRDDYDNGSPKLQIEDIEQLEYSYNSDELTRNLIVSFQTDQTDKNTVQEYQGTSFQVFVDQKRKVSDSKIMLTGAYDARVGFALAKEKTDLSAPEEILSVFVNTFDAVLGAIVKALNALIKVINRVIKIINKLIKSLDTIGINLSFEIRPIPLFKPPNLGDLIENRIGMMKIEFDSFNVPKVFLMQEGTKAKYNKIHSLNKTVLTAKYLYENYHFINSPVPTQDRPEGNQVKIITYPNHPFSLNSYNITRANNFVISQDGKTSRMTKCNWKIYDQKADITIRIPYLYTNNLFERYDEPNGF